ncbi:hypothetical protein F5Y17DRAFT_470502 [Xylariaceae sp. FL0594]|nr:hypothetical protein F5Y17DRAFT_470502 [Xylariaceae sp. FL0594]
MEPGAHESKCPRLLTTRLWSQNIVGQNVSLPQPNPARLPPASGGSHPYPPSCHEPHLPPTHHKPYDDRRLHQHHPPLTPVTQQAHYEAPHTFGPPLPMYPVTLKIQAASAKRKAQRASQACDNCRQLKVKCDETKPCKNCGEKDVECKYRDPHAKQPDKVTSEIRELNHIGTRLSVLENGSKQRNTNAAPIKLNPIEQDNPPGSPEASVSDVGNVPDEEVIERSTPELTRVAEPDMSPDEVNKMLCRIVEDNIEFCPGPTVKPGCPTMPLNHTTLASLLLNWKSISNMVQHILEAQHIRHVQEYPIWIEQQRGGLRTFGKGDEQNTYEAYLTSPASGQELWGQVGSPAYGPGVDYKGGARNSEGNPDWEPSKVWKYVQSFKETILNMHPIIIPKELDAMVMVFLETLPRSYNTPNYKPRSVAVTAGFVHPSSTAPSALPKTGVKRKWSPPTEEQSPHTTFRKPGRPYRNVQSTLVLLVLALGKICLYRGKMPDVVHDPEDIMSSSPLIYNDTNQAFMISRRSSLRRNVLLFNRTSLTHKRNLDVIPGLEYFALASDIMGADYDVFDLRHVHVHILAGLYQGQLGRVLDSWEHITSASRKLQVVLRPSLSRLTQLQEGVCGPESRRDNQLALAFWTCLQLESDILAELPLPQSGILQYETQMPYPNITFVTRQGFPEEIGQGYMAQLYLRKQLNNVHNLLYHPDREKNPQHIEAMVDKVDEIQQFLKHARNSWVPPYYTWNDGDDLPSDILSARLRANYWGSQVILYRPFLRLILEGDAQDPASLHRENAPLGPMSIEDRRVSTALIESTRAFHGIDTSSKRLIITNVFGTAHALLYSSLSSQWGNLLTLAACSKDGHLRQWIPADVLRGLFNKTIQFFRTISHPSSALTTDMNILIGLARELGLYNVPIGSSFSSVTSA